MESTKIRKLIEVVSEEAAEILQLFPWDDCLQSGWLDLFYPHLLEDSIYPLFMKFCIGNFSPFTTMSKSRMRRESSLPSQCTMQSHIQQLLPIISSELLASSELKIDFRPIVHVFARTR